MEESGDQIQLSQFLAHSSTDKMDAVFKLLHAIFCLNLKCKAFSFCSRKYLPYSFHHIHMIKAGHHMLVRITNYKFTILYLQKFKILQLFFAPKNTSAWETAIIGQIKGCPQRDYFVLSYQKLPLLKITD